jgi:hypothetical protein
MTKAVKITVGVVAFFAVSLLWVGIPGRLFVTPVVSVIDLRQQSNCDKLARVTGTVGELIDRQGYVQHRARM